MYLWRRFLIFCKDHWIGITATLSVIICVLLTWWGMSKLESFYRNMQLATMPMTMLMWLVASVISAFIYVWVMFGYFSRMSKKRVKGEGVNVHFDEVIGIDESKEEAIEVVQLLKDHARLKKVGGKILRGILMEGPPGCGKTYLAKAIATEAGIPFLSLAASDFVQVFVGVGASRVRKVFNDARRLSYANGACIIFIDEMDAIGRVKHVEGHQVAGLMIGRHPPLTLIHALAVFDAQFNPFKGLGDIFEGHLISFVAGRNES